MSSPCNCNHTHNLSHKQTQFSTARGQHNGQAASRSAQQKYANYFLAITGPTAVGKTAFVDDLSRLLNNKIEIINADVGQFYCPLTIGTAKPPLDNPTVPHHLFDLFDEPNNGTVMFYRQQVIRCLESVWQQGRLPIIVGGSLFYIKALFYPPHELSVADDKAISRAEISTSYDELTDDQLYNQVHAIDPERAQSINRHDRYRLIRALDIYKQTNQKPSSYKPTLLPLAHSSLIFLTRDRLELHQRINTRVDQMFQDGWMQEVENLSPAWRSFLKRKKLIGYPEIIDYLEQKTALEPQKARQNQETLEESIRKKTRAMAKRQLTFWRSFITLLRRERLRDSNMHRAVDAISEYNLSTNYQRGLEQIAHTVLSR